MGSKLFLILALGLSLFAVFATDIGLGLENRSFENPQAETIPVRQVGAQIAADGNIHSENEAILHFQTGGKLASLLVKEGDQVSQGTTIAQLDTYALQRQLQVAANAYQTAKNNNDQTVENQQSNVLEGQQRVSLDTTNKNSYTATPESTVIYDTVKRLVDNSQLAQNTAQLNVELANYSLQLSTLTAPFNGVITHEDVTTPGVNITTTTAFTVADPKSIVFRANVSADDIDFVHVGDAATVAITGSTTKTFSGTVSKIYQQRVTLPTGEEVYQVDIASSDLSGKAKLDQTGVAVIKSDTTSSTFLVPSWTVLNHSQLWVMENGQPVLKHVIVGKTHGDKVEILEGITSSDEVISNPASLATKKYKLL